MSKSIVVITGSPRMKGNSNAMAQAFIKAAERKGHKIVKFEAANMTLGGCHACKSCFSNGKACIFEDDFNLIAPRIEAADAIVMTMPVYWYSIPSQIKCVIDKLYAFVANNRSVAGKECALMACCEENDMSVFDGVRVPFRRTAELLGWKLVGEVLVPDVNEVGDILKTDSLQRAEELADKF